MNDVNFDILSGWYGTGDDPTGLFPSDGISRCTFDDHGEEGWEF